jgi:hypothetical protein
MCRHCLPPSAAIWFYAPTANCSRASSYNPVRITIRPLCVEQGRDHRSSCAFMAGDGRKGPPPRNYSIMPEIDLQAQIRHKCQAEQGHGGYIQNEHHAMSPSQCAGSPDFTANPASFRHTTSQLSKLITCAVFAPVCGSTARATIRWCASLRATDLNHRNDRTHACGGAVVV